MQHWLGVLAGGSVPSRFERERVCDVVIDSRNMYYSEIEIVLQGAEC